MDISNGVMAERIARVLAGENTLAVMPTGANARGDSASAATRVDESWREHLADATAVLKTMREPDRAMAAVGDVAVWERMILAALAEGNDAR